MNQRQELRLPFDKPVEVTVFGVPDIHLQGRIRNASGRGVGLELPGPLATGTPLKIGLEDSILLGEVIYCREQDGAWYTGVALEHALYSLSELAAALGSFEEPSGAECQHAAQYARRKHEQ